MDRTPADRPDHPRASERFNEDSATYSVRGSEAPDLEAGVAAIRNVLKTLPARPVFRNDGREVVFEHRKPDPVTPD